MGGIESNQVGTGEFVSLCKTVGAEPLMCVNFESDGRRQYMKAKESVRTADATDAAAWVAYCNDPRHAGRQAHGSIEPLGVRYWQIGNETSYDKDGFDLETAARKTVEFAKAMRAADSKIQLVAWGDSGWPGLVSAQAGNRETRLPAASRHAISPLVLSAKTPGPDLESTAEALIP